jgi:3-deoxy-manno-octulosonate cytidylyltransferase (CMP-KDO synthetase)
LVRYEAVRSFTTNKKIPSLGRGIFDGKKPSSQLHKKEGKILSKEKVIGVIPARYKSTRFEGKPLAFIKGKTLIQRTYESALKCPLLDEIYIATDDQRIQDHVSSFSAKSLLTSESCPNGTARIVEAYKLYPDLQSASIILNIQGDHPFISALTIEKIILALKSDPTAIASTAVTPFLEKEKALSPHLVKCVFDQNFHALYFSRSPIPYAKNAKPLYHAHIGIYAYRKEYLEKFSFLKATPMQVAEDLEQLQLLEYGFRMKIAVVDEEPLSVDIPEDIQKAEKYLCP